jgi:hypothetical protein
MISPKAESKKVEIKVVEGRKVVTRGWGVEEKGLAQSFRQENEGLRCTVRYSEYSLK